MIPLLRAVFAVMLIATWSAHVAVADNPMGYRLLSEQQARQLPHRGGSLGLDIERAERISDRGLTFDILRVKQAKSGAPGARAGLARGDEIIAVDGQVFESLVAFAFYVGSTPPNGRLAVDYIPAGGGPQQAQRVEVTVGGDQNSGGLSTGKKVAIGLGAAALFGCYELGCFSHRSNAATVPTGQVTR